MRDILIEITRKAGTIALDARKGLSTRYKGDRDVVTDADIRVEKFLKGEIERRFPGHSIISEESDEKKAGGDFTWVIDPIDGTYNYAIGLPLYCISVAILKKGQPLFGSVFAPSLGEFYFAEKGKGALLNDSRIKVSNNMDISKSLIYYSAGIDRGLMISRSKTEMKLRDSFERVRDIGALALETCFVAAAKGDAVMRYKESSKAWDYAAAGIILMEAGGRLTDIEGKDVRFGKPSEVVGTNKLIHDKTIEMVR